jgi:AraC-like DNA-binding protein
MTKIHVKNMVCNRCVLVVKSEIEKLGYEINSIELGEVILNIAISNDEKKIIATKLESFGFEILNDSNGKIIEKIKTTLIDLVQNKSNFTNLTLSEYLMQNIHHEYSKLSNLFSNVEGISIEKYYINLRIEKVKELIIYDELSLSEIAAVLNYSSVAHLSNQFKKTTGFTPSYFKKIKESKRKELDQL